MKALSLVMVVKDVEALLPDFLAHHAGLADEIIIIDTGSTDATTTVARGGGGKVWPFTWSEDFSAARNHGLKQATGRWILILDPDQRLSRRDIPRLREAVLAAEPCVFVQDTINYCADPSHLEWRPVRGSHPTEESGQQGYFLARQAGLFPRREDLRFSGRVHESVLPAAQRAGLPVKYLAIPVHHYGYVLSSGHNAARAERYARLVALKFEEDPDDPASQLELATVKLEQGRPELARSLLEKLVQGPANLRPVARGLFLLGRLLRERGEHESAGILLRKAVNGDPSFTFGWLELIRVLADQERWTEVNTAIGEARRLAEPRDPEDPLLLKEELRLLVKSGQLLQAKKIAAKLVDIYPAWQDIQALHSRLQRWEGGSCASTGN